MKKAFTLVEIVIVIVIIGLLVAMAIPACQKIRTHNPRQHYELWCKLQRRTDISFEEWKELRSAGLLPSQTTR